jgi:hypothetical protein
MGKFTSGLMIAKAMLWPRSLQVRSALAGHDASIKFVRLHAGEEMLVIVTLVECVVIGEKSWPKDAL